MKFIFEKYLKKFTINLGPQILGNSQEIRNIFEKFENEALENGFIVWKLNSRWVTSRWMYDWGEQERKLAEWFYDDAKKIKKDYPRTAKILKQLWDSYNFDAKREDERVELDRW